MSSIAGIFLESYRDIICLKRMILGASDLSNDFLLVIVSRKIGFNFYELNSPLLAAGRFVREG